MARMPTGTPRSVPDPYGDDYDEMMRQWRASQGTPPGGAPPQTSAAGTRPPPTPMTGGPAPQGTDTSLLDQAGQAFSRWQHSKPIGHPGFAESLIPVWGSGRDAVADLQEGDYSGAALKGALAVSDLIPAEAVAGSLEKGAWKGGSHAWSATRKWLGKEYLEPGQHGHHWLIPQNGWGKDVPDWLKNQPWNIKGMPSPEVHGRIHGRYNGPQFNPAQRFWYGTPAWVKAVAGEAVGRPAAAGWEASKQQQ